MLRLFVCLLLTVLTVADNENWYEMHTPYGSVNMDDGWAKPATGEGAKATLFEDFPYGNNLYIMVMSGVYKGYYLAGHYDSGIGAFGKWSDASYFSWSGNNLISRSFRTSGLSMTYGPSGYFYFYPVTGQYRLVNITRQYTNRPGYKPSVAACPATSINGTWKYMFMLPGQTTTTLTHGTTKRNAESKTDEWSNSVFVKSTSKLIVKDSFEQSIEIGNEYRKAATQMYSKEWSSNTEESWQVQFSEVEKGKALWQFVFDIRDSCDHEEFTITRDFALTPKISNPPCCLPGYVNDAPYYTSCSSPDHLIEKQSSRCVVDTTKRLPVKSLD